MVCGKRKRIVDEELLNNGYEKKYGKRFRRSESSTWSRVSKKSHHHNSLPCKRNNKKFGGNDFRPDFSTYHNESQCHDSGYSCRHSRPTYWSIKNKRKGRCACRRHSDSGFDTKSVWCRRQSRNRCRQKVKEDEEGHLIYEEGDILQMRYKLGRTIGQGTFGKVVAAIDLETDKRVAVKIVRKDHADYEDAKLEAEILVQLQTISSGSENLCIRILEWFDYHGHLCLVFDLLGHSIYEFLRRNHYQPFPMKDVQKIAYQMCKAVKFCHDNGLAHTDLKPENILFVDSRLEITENRNNYGRMRGEYRRIKNCDIRLIDFGSAVFEKDHNKGIVSTRQYRAPEVVLDEGWSFPCDVWSLGCILFELYTGSTLFQTHDSVEHLAMMERILDRIPSSMINKCPKSKFFKNGRLNWDINSRAGRKVRKSCRALNTYMTSHSLKDKQLFDLIRQMLEFRPSRRITLSEALRHPFFSERHSSCALLNRGFCNLCVA